MYSAGLRVSEVCHLRYDHILRSQKMIYVSKSKNRQDRYSILSDHCLKILTEYWHRYNRPRGWLFPSPMRDAPVTTATAQLVMKDACAKLGFSGNSTPHTLRHSFAVHLLEEGVSQTFIQQLLGLPGIPGKPNYPHYLVTRKLERISFI